MGTVTNECRALEWPTPLEPSGGWQIAAAGGAVVMLVCL